MLRWGHRHHSPVWECCLLMLRLSCNWKKIVNLCLCVVFCAGYGLHWFNLAGIKAFTGKTLSCYPSTQNQWTVKQISLGRKKTHLFRIPRQRSNKDIDVYVWVLLLSTKEASLHGGFFFWDFISSLQIFAPNPLWFFSLHPVHLHIQMMLQHCPRACTINMQEWTWTHIHTNKSVKSLMLACKHSYMCEKCSNFSILKTVPTNFLCLLSFTMKFCSLFD